VFANTGCEEETVHVEEKRRMADFVEKQATNIEKKKSMVSEQGDQMGRIFPLLNDCFRWVDFFRKLQKEPKHLGYFFAWKKFC
jgi:hypothetical protein